MSVAPVLPLRSGESPAADLGRALGIPTATMLLDRVRPRPVDPALAGLFARGGLPRGEIVALAGRHVLALALACCAATTAAGGWCAGIGLGEPAVAALRDMGIELSRFVCLRTPAQDWMRVVSVLVDSFAVLVVAPGFAASAAERARLEAKLRESGATLLFLEDGEHDARPGSSSSRGRRAGGTGTRARGERIEVLGEDWDGLEHGAGRLLRRRLRLRSARTGEHCLVLPDPQGRVRAVSQGLSAVPQPSEAHPQPSEAHTPAGTLRVLPGGAADRTGTAGGTP
ncbi:hypothetical protein [Brevibacterium album]|uniref:hypothetical protein n=1 Tax=Brevibacterium album TaxID=417948 RepID=UPI0003F4FA2B|nr:hypothetical protein [Brevibacterium album]